MDILSLFKIKMDLKETVMSPYKLPFNNEMLQERSKIESVGVNELFYKYTLPDGETIIDVGNQKDKRDRTDEDEDFLYEVIECYENSDRILKKDKKFNIAQETPDHEAYKHTHPDAEG